MLKSLEILFERLAQRCLAIAAGMLASKLESLQIALWTEQQQQLEQQARALEADGADELARSLRERIKTLSSDDPGAHAESWFQELATRGPSTGLNADSNAARSLLPQSTLAVTDDAMTRRPSGRSKRQRLAVDAVPPAPSSTTPGDVFFPIESSSQPVSREEVSE